MREADLEVTDEALTTMRHRELVALLNRLYARCGEPALAASTASASSDDELRDRIRGVRRRVLAKANGRGPAVAAPGFSAADGCRSASPARGVAPARRAFVVLVSDDQALARRARSSCSARGIVLVSVASQERLMKLITSVTPNCVVIEEAADRVDEASVRELASRGVQVRWCRGADETLDALAEIA
jgi:hypothetical protein